MDQILFLYFILKYNILIYIYIYIYIIVYILYYFNICYICYIYKIFIY